MRECSASGWVRVFGLLEFGLLPDRCQRAGWWLAFYSSLGRSSKWRGRRLWDESQFQKETFPLWEVGKSTELILEFKFEVGREKPTVSDVLLGEGRQEGLARSPPLNSGGRKISKNLNMTMNRQLGLLEKTFYDFFFDCVKVGFNHHISGKAFLARWSEGPIGSIKFQSVWWNIRHKLLDKCLYCFWNILY